MVPLPTSAAAAISSIVTASMPRREKRSMAADKIWDRAAIFFRSRRDATMVNYDYSHDCPWVSRNGMGAWAAVTPWTPVAVLHGERAQAGRAVAADSPAAHCPCGCSQGPQEVEDRLFVGGGQGGELSGPPGGFGGRIVLSRALAARGSMSLDRFQQIARPSVVQEENALADAPERRGPEHVTLREASREF